MTSAEEMIRRFTCKEINRIKKLCEPLQRHFGITFFYCSVTTVNGGFFSVGNSAELQEYYYVNKLYVESPFFHNSSLIDPGVYSYSCIHDTKFRESINTFANAFGIELGVCLVERRGKELLRFGYASDLFQGPEFLVSIINNLSILKEFNNYFLDKIQPIIKSNDSVLLDLSSNLGVDYNTKPRGLNTVTTCHDKINFLDDLGVVKKEKIAKLSHREKDCLKNLPSGLSYREIGDVLMLETRTVESYMVHTKFKLDCNSKRELIATAKLLDICGCFD